MDLLRILGYSTRSGPLTHGRVAFLLVVLSLWLLRSPKLASRVVGLAFLFIAGLLTWLGERPQYQFRYPHSAQVGRVYLVAAVICFAVLLSFAGLPQGMIAAFRHALVVVTRAVLSR